MYFAFLPVFLVCWMLNMGFNIPRVFMFFLLHRGRGKQKSEISQRQKKARMRGALILKVLRMLMKTMIQHEKKKKVTMKRLELKMRKTKQKMKSHLIRKFRQKRLKRRAQGPKVRSNKLLRKVLKNRVKSPPKELPSQLHPHPRSKKLIMKSLRKGKARNSQLRHRPRDLKRKVITVLSC